MLVYILLAILPLLVRPLFVTNKGIFTVDKHKKNKYFLVFCGCLLFLAIALRHYSVGSADSLHYYQNWIKWRDIGNFEVFWNRLLSANMEKGYILSIWLLSRFFYDPQWLFVFSGLFFSISVCTFIYRNSKDVAISFILFVCLGLYEFMVQGLRQAIAMSICLFAIEFCKRRKFIPFLLLVILASFFHRTAIIFAFIYFCYGMKYNIITLFLMILFAVALIVFGDVITNLGNVLFNREYEGAVETGGFIAVTIYVLIILLSITSATDKVKRSNDYVFFLIFTTIGLVFYSMRFFENLIIERISFYFMFGQIILIPSSLCNFDSVTRKIVSAIVVILSFSLFAYRLSGSSLVPYKFFF